MMLPSVGTTTLRDVKSSEGACCKIGYISEKLHLYERQKAKRLNGSM